MDPTFRLMRSHSMAKLVFFFIYFVKKNWFLEKSWSRHLFLFYFFKGKQNKKENPKCDSWRKIQVCEKLSLGPRVRLLIGKVW